MHRSAGASLVILILTFSVVPIHTAAWGNGGYSSDPDHPDYGIHDWIADKALSFQTADIAFLLTTYHADYLLGTEAPDNDDYIGDSYDHHFYYRASGQVQSDAAASRAREMYNLSLAALKTSNYQQGAYYAGAMAHYISDVGAYGHTMGVSTEWGASAHHSAYEDHVHSMLGSLAAPKATAIPSKDAYNATASLARSTTFGSGSIQANTWMETTYDWGNPAFVSSCLESLNASVRAVASALESLLDDAGMYQVPELWHGGCAVVMIAMILLLARRIR